MEQDKLIELQKTLEVDKWLVSEKDGDRSGVMPYCDFCPYQHNLHFSCMVLSQQAHDNCYCATAYLKMKEKENAKK